MTIETSSRSPYTAGHSSLAVVHYVIRHNNVNAASKMSGVPTANMGIGRMRNNMLIAELLVTTVNERDRQLDIALAEAESKAYLEPGFGILVTRHDFRRFTVWLTTDVPYGTIEERDYARR